MAKKSFYAVKAGHKPGIYESWEECQAQVEGYSKAVFKGFPTLAAAKEYLNVAANGGRTGRVSDPLPLSANLPLAKGERREAAGGRSHTLSLTSPSVNVSGGSQSSTPPVDSHPLKQIVIYTDGACTGNPGPGGYGVVLIHGEHRKELSAGFRLTTNNRMEILACIAGLEALKEPCRVTIYSDSKYVVNTISKSWALKWRSGGWKRTLKNGKKKDALNADLWAQMLDLCDKHHVTLKWVRGHDGNEGNERCDELARAAASSHRLGIDAFYEQPKAARA